MNDTEPARFHSLRSQVSRGATRSPVGFTLVELLVVIAIISLLAAIIVPVFASAREQSRKTACLSNLRQIGMAVLTYSTDFDETHPTMPNAQLGQIITNMGWAGRVFPYVKNVGIYHCPSDPTEPAKFPGYDDLAPPVSYGLNMNYSLVPSASAAAAPSRTVMAFEVVGDNALITREEEGLSSANVPPQASVVGVGINDGMDDVTVTTYTSKYKKDGSWYATSKLDNYEAPGDNYSDDFRGKGRHSEGSNFLAADGHVKWLPGKSVSAGGNARRSTDNQASTGCLVLRDPKAPCAEGTSVGVHRLTFSVR